MYPAMTRYGNVGIMCIRYSRSTQMVRQSPLNDLPYLHKTGWRLRVCRGIFQNVCVRLVVIDDFTSSLAMA